MRSELGLFKNYRGFLVAGLLAIAGSKSATADDNTYTWSAELVAVNQQARTATVQSRLVSDADVDFERLERGDPVTLTWSGINTAAGIRRITNDKVSDDRLTLPVEFVSGELDNRYVRFTVPVPSEDLAKIASLTPGQWVTGTSPHQAAMREDAVRRLRPYNDIE